MACSDGANQANIMPGTIPTPEPRPGCTGNFTNLPLRVEPPLRGGGGGGGGGGGDLCGTASTWSAPATMNGA